MEERDRHQTEVVADRVEGDADHAKALGRMIHEENFAKKLKKSEGSFQNSEGRIRPNSGKMFQDSATYQEGDGRGIRVHIHRKGGVDHLLESEMTGETRSGGAEADPRLTHTRYILDVSSEWEL